MLGASRLVRARKIRSHHHLLTLNAAMASLVMQKSLVLDVLKQVAPWGSKSWIEVVLQVHERGGSKTGNPKDP